MRISYRWLRDYIGLRAGTSDIAHRLTMAGLEVEEVISIQGDTVFDISLTPNRGDAASHWGVARELGLLYNKTPHLPKLSALRYAPHTPESMDIRLEAPQACPRYCALHVSGLTIKPSPQWMQTRLKRIGLSPINHVVDTTNYIMHAIGQPLHAFDRRHIAGNTIIVRQASDSSSMHLLDGSTHILQSGDLLICDEQKPLALAGIMGGAQSSIQPSTTDIVLESAYFTPYAIRRTQARLKLTSEAAFRYARGADPDQAHYALRWAAHLLLDSQPNAQCGKLSERYPERIRPRSMTICLNALNQVAGSLIPHATARRFLRRLVFAPKKKTPMQYRVQIPAYRSDISAPIHVYEHIIRLYGYDHLGHAPYIRYQPSGTRAHSHRFAQRRKIVDELAAMGFHELILPSLLAQSRYTHLPLWQQSAAEYIHVLHPASQYMDTLRPDLLYSGLEWMAYNLHRKQSRLMGFEVGQVYRKRHGMYSEASRLGIYMTGARYQPNWHAQRSSDKVSLYDLIEVVGRLLLRFGLCCTTHAGARHLFASPACEWKHNDQVVAYGGFVQPSLLAACAIFQPVLAANIRLPFMMESNTQPAQYHGVLSSPPVFRDISLVFNRKISYAELRDNMARLRTDPIQSMRLTDVHTGKGLGKGQVAFTLSIKLQSNQTLTSAVIESTMKRIQVFFENLGAVIRTKS